MPPTRRSARDTVSAKKAEDQIGKSRSKTSAASETPSEEKPAASSPGRKRKTSSGGAKDDKDEVNANPKSKTKANDAKSKSTTETSSPPASKKPKSEKPAKTTPGGHSISPSAPSSSKVDILAYEGSPKNVDIPKDLSSIISPPASTTVARLTSWNIVSLKSSEPKGLTRYLEAEDADGVFLSETKVNEVPSFFLKEKYPHQVWAIGETKSYAGVALLSKFKPVSVVKGLPTLSGYDSKGRCVIVEFAGCYVVGTYCVNAGEGLKTINEKRNWQEALSRKINELDKTKPVIWTGDLNVVLDERDLSKAGTKWNKSAGYTQIECDHHRAFLNGKLDNDGKPPQPPIDQDGDSQDGPKRNAVQTYSDVWRQLHPDEQGHFSYYGWRGQCRIKGSGWRLDTFIASQRIAHQCKSCEIRQHIYGASDHVPVYSDWDRTLFE